MSIENTEVVDVVGISVDSGEVVLTVSDHLPWDDPADHFAALEAKLAAYVRYVESGQILERYPDAITRGIRVDVVLLHPASPEAVRFFGAARHSLAERRIGLRHFVL